MVSIMMLSFARRCGAQVPHMFDWFSFGQGAGRTWMGTACTHHMHWLWENFRETRWHSPAHFEASMQTIWTARRWWVSINWVHATICRIDEWFLHLPFQRRHWRVWRMLHGFDDTKWRSGFERWRKVRTVTQRVTKYSIQFHSILNLWCLNER